MATLHDREALLEIVKSKDVQKIYGPPDSTLLEVPTLSSSSTVHSTSFVLILLLRAYLSS